jgi:thiopurine S-methyltransferase
VPGLTLYCGDVFAVTAAHLSGVSAVYDRAALVALPGALRQRYVSHLGALLMPGTVGLLVALERTVAVDAGPPFSVPEQDVRALYEPAFSVLRLASYEPDERGLRESVYRVERR